MMVSIGYKPAAFIVSPDSTKSTMASPTPKAQEASTDPLTYLIFVFKGSPSLTPSSFSKYLLVKWVKEETIVLPMSCSGFSYGPCWGTWIWSLHFPKRRSMPIFTSTSDSMTWSYPVIPTSQRPSPTKVGMSAAGRKIRAIGRFRQSAMSSLLDLLNCMSAPFSICVHFS